ncbi:MAG: ubiquinone/menaquinone biosynthesis methyltransferase [Armatimonadetes bacterium]|nr:ubiquinone/menaquinone biosynthesis methyltransferase [Armatimonadota bacterium]
MELKEIVFMRLLNTITEAAALKNSRMFSKISKNYDFLNALLSFRQDKIIRRRLVEISKVKAKERVLDVCTGTGELAYEFYKIVKNKGEVIGVDLSKDMLKIAKKKFPQIKFEFGDALNLNFKKNYFNFVSIAFGLRNLENLKKFFLESFKVLKKGGKIISLELTFPENIILKFIYYPYLRFILPLLGGIISHNFKAYNYLAKSIINFISNDDIKLIMETAGFKNVKYIPLKGGLITIHLGEKL